MVEEQLPRPTTFKEICALAFQNSTPESRENAVVVALGGKNTKRAQAYRDMMARLNAALSPK